MLTGLFKVIFLALGEIVGNSGGTSSVISLFTFWVIFLEIVRSLGGTYLYSGVSSVGIVSRLAILDPEET
jgi:hypothetical protein